MIYLIRGFTLKKFVILIISYNKKMKAYTLMELLVVVVIIGILGVTTFSAYQSYIVRAQVNSAVQILYMQQLEITKYADVHGTLPTVQDIAPVTGPPFIDNTVVETNQPTQPAQADIIKVEVQFSNNANDEISNKTIVLEGKVNKEKGTWTWLCRNSTDSNAIKNKYLPNNCQYTGQSCPASFCLSQ